MEILKTDEDLYKLVSLADNTNVGFSNSQTIIPHYTDEKTDVLETGGEQLFEFLKNEYNPFGLSYAYDDTTDTGIEMNLYYNNDRVIEEMEDKMSFERKGRTFTKPKDLIDNNEYITAGRIQFGNDHYIPLPDLFKKEEYDKSDDLMENVFREMVSTEGISVYIQHTFVPIQNKVWTNRVSLTGSFDHHDLVKGYIKKSELVEKQYGTSLQSATEYSSDQLESGLNLPIRTPKSSPDALADNLRETAKDIQDRVINSQYPHFATQARILVAGDSQEQVAKSIQYIKDQYEYKWGTKSNNLVQQYIEVDVAETPNEIEQLVVNSSQKQTAVNRHGLLRKPYKIPMLHSVRKHPMILHPKSVSQLAHIPSENLNIRVERVEDDGFGGFYEDQQFTDS